MNDRFRSFDFDGFGSAYQPPSTKSIVQGQQRYLTNNGPCSESYDPNRMLDPLRMPTYNTTAAGLQGAFQNNANGTHQTFLAARGGVIGVTSPAAGLQLQGMTDFEPMPLSSEALRRLNPNLPAFQQAGLTADVLENELRRRQEINNSTIMPDPFSQSSNAFVKPQFETSSPAFQLHLENKDAWLDEIELKVSGLSLEPLKGSEVMKTIEMRTDEVLTKYLPCVDFLVACQQELRRGLAAATTKKLVHRSFRDAMTPRQFYNTYIAELPRRFIRKNQKIMKPDDLSDAVKELQKLCADAKAVEHQGCEVVKNTFLGGMKDGESWGLRKWLSKHGGALHICNDCECILNACQKLDRSLDTTRKLSARLRPLAKKVLSKLKADVPSSYQEQSSAHPYLPFFHRLEACLRGMSNFDPEDDDVICIDDDDEVEAIKANPPPPRVRSRKRKAAGSESPSQKQAACAAKSDDSDDDDDSVIEILDVKPPPKAQKTKNANEDSDDSRMMNDLLRAFDEDDSSSSELFAGLYDKNLDQCTSEKKDSIALASDIDRLAGMFDRDEYSLIRPKNIGATSFWEEAAIYASALRLFSDILRAPESASLIEQAEDETPGEEGQPPYSSVIKNPLCFRDIVSSLILSSNSGDEISGNNGLLPAQGLSSWNMWRGIDLLQAIDLVFLNSLAYGKASDDGRSVNRSNVNKLRKLFWSGINRIIDSNIGAHDAKQRKHCTPTRRGETSGFVVYKGR